MGNPTNNEKRPDEAPSDDLQADRLQDAFLILYEQHQNLVEFARKVSHDLRSPITNMNVLISLSERTGRESDKALYMTRLGNSIDKFLNTLDALTKERREAIFIDPQKNEVVLNRIFNPEPAIKQSGAKITADFSNCESFLFDDGRLRFIFAALVSPQLLSGEEVGQAHFKSYKDLQYDVLEVQYNKAFSWITESGELEHGEELKNKDIKKQLFDFYFVKVYMESAGGKIELETIRNKGTSIIKLFFLRPN